MHNGIGNHGTISIIFGKNPSYDIFVRMDVFFDAKIWCAVSSMNENRHCPLAKNVTTDELYLFKVVVIIDLRQRQKSA